MTSQPTISKGNYYKLIFFNILFIAFAPLIFLGIMATLQPLVGLILMGMVLLVGEEAANSGAESLAFLSIPLSMLFALVILIILWRLFDKKFLVRYKKGAA